MVALLVVVQVSNILVHAPHTLSKPQRREEFQKLWDVEVGELPEDGLSKLLTYVGVYGVIPVTRAIQRVAALESLEDSEDVLLGVRIQLESWKKRGWCP